MDNPVAIYFGGIFIYWHGLIMALAVIVSMLCAVFFRKVRNESAAQLITVALIGFIPAILCGRAFYCYFSQESFSGFSEMLKINDGGTSLYGAAAGFLIAVGIYCAVKKIDFLSLLDSFAPAAAIGIFIGRLSSYFSGDDIGRAVTNEKLQKYPFAVFFEERNEWNLAVFNFEAAAAAAIFVVLLYFIFIDNKKLAERSRGDIALLFIFMYGISQTVFESMRSDSLFLISLGFVRISQVISILLATFAFIIFSIRSAKKGLSWLHFTGWGICTGCITLAFWMEFCMTAANSTRNYIIMSLCLAVYLFFGLALYFDSQSDNKQNI